MRTSMAPMSRGRLPSAAAPDNGGMSGFVSTQGQRFHQSRRILVRRRVEPLVEEQLERFGSTPCGCRPAGDVPQRLSRAIPEAVSGHAENRPIEAGTSAGESSSAFLLAIVVIT